MRLHSTRAPDARAAWRTGLAALACSLGLAAVLLGGRLLPAAGGLCRAGGTGAGAQADAAPPGGSPARLQQPRPPPANNKTSLLVVLARHEEDIRWVDRLPEAVRSAPALQIIIYQTPGEEVAWAPDSAALEKARVAAAAPAEPKIDAQWYSKHWPVRYTPLNRGHEAMAYTTAILDHWGSAGEGLPDHVAFMHAHQWSTHTHLSHDWVIRALATHRPHGVPLGYADAQCGEQLPIQSLEHHYDLQNLTWNMIDLSTSATLADWLDRKGVDASVDFERTWQEGTLQRWLGPLPRQLHGPSNAEFVASREALSRHPRQFWEELRDHLMTTPQLSYRPAIVLEWLWHFILTGQSIVNTPQAECMCQLYGLCLPN